MPYPNIRGRRIPDNRIIKAVTAINTKQLQTITIPEGNPLPKGTEDTTSSLKKIELPQIKVIIKT